MSVSFLCHNVTAFAIIVYCTKLEKMALRATCRWLAAFIEKQKIEPDELPGILYQDELVRVFEASIHPDSVYWYNQQYTCVRGDFITGIYDTVIQFDCLLGYQFLQRRFQSKQAWNYRLHERNWSYTDVKVAIRHSATDIIKYLIYGMLNSMEKRVELFWLIAHYGTVDILKWFINENILSKAFLHRCPAPPNYMGDIDSDKFTRNIRFLRNFLNQSVFDALMLHYTVEYWMPGRVIIIATETNYVPSELCKKLKRITKDNSCHRILQEERDRLHEHILPICGGHKPVRKRDKK